MSQPYQPQPGQQYPQQGYTQPAAPQQYQAPQQPPAQYAQPQQYAPIPGQQNPVVYSQPQQYQGYNGNPSVPQQGQPQGYPMPGQPATPPPPPAARGSVDEAYTQGSWTGAYGSAVKFRMVNDTFQGIVARDVTDADVRQETDPSGTPQFMPDGRTPRWQMTVHFDVQASAVFPEAKATLYAKRGVLQALTRALALVNAEDGLRPQSPLKKGDHFWIVRTPDSPTRFGSARHEFDAVVTRAHKLAAQGGQPAIPLPAAIAAAPAGAVPSQFGQAPAQYAPPTAPYAPQAAAPVDFSQVLGAPAQSPVVDPLAYAQAAQSQMAPVVQLPTQPAPAPMANPASPAPVVPLPSAPAPVTAPSDIFTGLSPVQVAVVANSGNIPVPAHIFYGMPPEFQGQVLENLRPQPPMQAAA